MKKFVFGLLMSFQIFACSEASNDPNPPIPPTPLKKLSILVLPISDDNYLQTRKIDSSSDKLTYKISDNETYLEMIYDYNTHQITLKNGTTPFLISGSVFLEEDEKSSELPFILTTLVKGAPYYNDAIAGNVDYETLFEVSDDLSQNAIYKNMTFTVSPTFPNRDVLALTYKHEPDTPYQVKESDIILDFDNLPSEKKTIETSNDKVTHTYEISYIPQGKSYTFVNAKGKSITIIEDSDHILIDYYRANKRN